MDPAIPEPTMMVETEDGKEAVVRWACRNGEGGVCHNECVEVGRGRPGSAVGGGYGSIIVPAAVAGRAVLIDGSLVAVKIEPFVGGAWRKYTYNAVWRRGLKGGVCVRP
jgi:hypothetical protein